MAHTPIILQYFLQRSFANKNRHSLVESSQFWAIKTLPPWSSYVIVTVQEAGTPIRRHPSCRRPHRLCIGRPDQPWSTRWTAGVDAATWQGDLGIKTYTNTPSDIVFWFVWGSLEFIIRCNLQLRYVVRTHLPNSCLMFLSQFLRGVEYGWILTHRCPNGWIMMNHSVPEFLRGLPRPTELWCWSRGTPASERGYQRGYHSFPVSIWRKNTLNGVNDYFTRISGKHFNVYLPKRGKQDGEIAPILQQGASDNIHPLASAMGPL